MAIQAHSLGVYGGVDGQPITITAHYDDVSMFLTDVVCDNQSTSSARVTGTVISNGRTFNKICPGNTVTTQVLPTSAGQRLDVFIDAKGRLDGVDWEVRVPA